MEVIVFEVRPNLKLLKLFGFNSVSFSLNMVPSILKGISLSRLRAENKQSVPVAIFTLG